MGGCCHFFLGPPSLLLSLFAVFVVTAVTMDLFFFLSLLLRLYMMLHWQARIQWIKDLLSAPLVERENKQSVSILFTMADLDESWMKREEKRDKLVNVLI
jgi:hypothetical protein